MMLYTFLSVLGVYPRRRPGTREADTRLRTAETDAYIYIEGRGGATIDGCGHLSLLSFAAVAVATIFALVTEDTRITSRGVKCARRGIFSLRKYYGG